MVGWRLVARGADVPPRRGGRSPARSAPARAFDLCSDVTAVDWPPRAAALRRDLLPVLHPASVTGCVSKFASATATPCRPVSSVWPAASWLEREVFDLFGIRVRRASRPAPHPDAGGVAGPSAAEGLPARGAGRNADGEPDGLAAGEARGGHRVTRRGWFASRGRPDVRHDRARSQHGAAAPEHPRRAACGAASRRRARRRLGRGHRLPPSRHREALRAPRLGANRVAHRPDGLRRRGEQQPGLLRDGREAHVARGAAARAVHPDDPGGTAADRQPLPLARHACHGPGRHDGVPLRLPRARAGAGSVRGILRRPAHLQRDAHWRPSARHPERAGTARYASSATSSREGGRVRRAPDAESASGWIGRAASASSAATRRSRLG